MSFDSFFKQKLYICLGRFERQLMSWSFLNIDLALTWIGVELCQASTWWFVSLNFLTARRRITGIFTGLSMTMRSFVSSMVPYTFFRTMKSDLRLKDFTIGAMKVLEVSNLLDNLSAPALEMQIFAIERPLYL